MASFLRGFCCRINGNLIKVNSSSVHIQQKRYLITIKFAERFKGTVLEKWSNYWKQLYLDYKEVAIDVSKEARNKPIKSLLYGCLFGGGYLCAKNNPDELSFINQIRLYNKDMILVHESCHNPESSQHLRFLEQCINAGLIRRLSLGVISFIWLDNYDECVALYKATCPYLKPKYTQFHERIIDIGFWNKWWKLDEKMIDYDVNI